MEIFAKKIAMLRQTLDDGANGPEAEIVSSSLMPAAAFGVWSPHVMGWLKDKSIGL